MFQFLLFGVDRAEDGACFAESLARDFERLRRQCQFVEEGFVPTRLVFPIRSSPRSVWTRQRWVRGSLVGTKVASDLASDARASALDNARSSLIIDWLNDLRTRSPPVER
jgi:hypothetical protein